ncbi:hypothetical protein SVAN01_10735 [Stagonosporopsis vannaccii]|nr:hypothetical protein SVAN01_10735 [Stagonosporopsis vannaccii]
MAFVPEDYTPIIEAGRGVTSRVYYCLPRRAVTVLTEIGPLTLSSIGFDGLKRSIVAVKVSPAKLLITREVSALCAIHQSTCPDASTLKRHFLSFTNTGLFGPLGRELAYITLPAITPPVTLDDLLQACSGEGNAPIPLVYHFFLSLVPTILFLRDEVHWAHNDVKGDNIMCRMYEGCPYNLPEFVVVDFGMAYEIAAFKNDSGDCKNVLNLVREFAEKAGQSADLQWQGFKRMLDGEKNRDRWQVDDEMGKIWESWRDIAVEERRKRKVLDVDRVEKLFENVVQEKGKISDEMVVSAVQH